MNYKKLYQTYNLKDDPTGWYGSIHTDNEKQAIIVNTGSTVPSTASQCSQFSSAWNDTQTGKIALDYFVSETEKGTLTCKDPDNPNETNAIITCNNGKTNCCSPQSGVLLPANTIFEPSHMVRPNDTTLPQCVDYKSQKYSCGSTYEKQKNTEGFDNFCTPDTGNIFNNITGKKYQGAYANGNIDDAKQACSSNPYCAGFTLSGDPDKPEKASAYALKYKIDGVQSSSASSSIFSCYKKAPSCNRDDSGIYSDSTCGGDCKLTKLNGYKSKFAKTCDNYGGCPPAPYPNCNTSLDTDCHSTYSDCTSSNKCIGDSVDSSGHILWQDDTSVCCVGDGGDGGDGTHRYCNGCKKIDPWTGNCIDYGSYCLSCSSSKCPDK